MMMSKTHMLPHLRNYERAHTFFMSTKKPPRSKKYKDNERPLWSVSQPHYKIVRRNNGEYYDLQLYGTVMARLYKPSEYERVCLYKYHYSNTSNSFLLNVCGMGIRYPQINVFLTTDGENVVAPIYYGNSLNDGDDKFSLRLVFDKHGKLIKKKSWHEEHYVAVSTADDRDERKRVKEILAPYIDLACMRFNMYEANVTLQAHLGAPFGGVTGRGTNGRAHHIGAIRAIANGKPTQEHIDKFFETGQLVFDTLASKRGYAQELALPSRWHHQWAGNTNYDTYESVEKRVTEKEFERALISLCMRLTNNKGGTGRRYLPAFMRKEDYPTGQPLV